MKRTKSSSFINISRVYGVYDHRIDRVSGAEMNHYPSIENAYITVSEGIITDIGSMSDFVASHNELVDLTNKVLFPTYCDSHTHIVFAEPRVAEFEMKIAGNSYEEIAMAGGGILQSALKLNEMSEEQLYQKAFRRVQELIAMGTGALEIKSGYGLTIEAEIKMLRVIKRLRDTIEIPIVATFLGAHAIPAYFKNNIQQYIEEVILPTMDIVAKEKLAKYIDIFVEKNYFSIEMSAKILEYAHKLHLIPKLHVNQLSNMGGVQLGVSNHALSVDHLEEMSQTEIDVLKNSPTIATLLPSCSFFIKIPYAPARAMIDQGLPIALATDYNPGSTPSGNMNFVISLACLYMNLMPNEALNASTINGAYAMGLSEKVGSISIGKQANFFTTEHHTTPAHIAYSFGKPIIETVYINGLKYPQS